MRQILSTLTLALLLSATSLANVVQRAPDFTWPGAGNKSRSLRSLHGVPVVLVIASTPKNKQFKKQIALLKETYLQLAARGAIFIAAFREGDGPVHSDIPFVVANSGSSVASGYNVQGDFSIVVIGKDGNVDCQSTKVLPGERVRDLIINNFEVQNATRK